MKNKKRHDCANCDFMKSLEDNSGRIFHFCMFDQSDVYLGEVEIDDCCELDGFAEELYCEQTDK